MARKPASSKAQQNAARTLRDLLAAFEEDRPGKLQGHEAALVRRLEGATSALEASAGSGAPDATEDA